MIIRKATQLDLPFIIKEGINFLQYHPAKISKDINIPHLISLANNLIENHIIFIAEKDNISCGMIGGIVSSHIYNPNYFLLTELFWWVVEEYRNSFAALKLLKTFEDFGKELKVNAISMTSTIYTPSLEKLYKKKGYIPMENSYIKEL